MNLRTPGTNGLGELILAQQTKTKALVHTYGRSL